MPRYSTYSDERLLELIANDDREAYTAFYMKYHEKIFRYLAIALRSKQDAEEILQDIFLKIWIKRATLPGIRSVENYLYKIVKNKLIDFARSNKQKGQVNILLLPEASFATNSLSENLILKEYHSAAQQAIGLLPERRRKMFLLNAQEELSAAEIADQLGTTLAVVQKQIYKASHFIRSYLQSHSELLIISAVVIYTI